MDASLSFLFFISTFLISIQQSLCAETTCNSTVTYSCGATGPLIRFPFWLKGQQPDLCSFKEFELSCNNKSQTVINFPTSGEFIVKRIDYSREALFINDENSCLPNRMQNFTLWGTPFAAVYLRKYKFIRCSTNWTEDSSLGMYRPVSISCLSGRNRSVYAVNSLISNRELPSYCGVIETEWSVSEYWSAMNFLGELRLAWSDPRCWPCAANGLACEPRDGEIGCVSPRKSGLPKTAKYGIIVGVGIPVVLLILAIAGYTCGRIRAYDIRRRLDTELSATITPQPVITITGLDGRVIESYPKTELGESGRLPKPNDITCPICLCEYQPKETLRSIPECNHYFHANCIDEWLKLNGTCPLCRNSPESLPITPFCSSISSSTSITSSS